MFFRFSLVICMASNDVEPQEKLNNAFSFAYIFPLNKAVPNILIMDLKKTSAVYGTSSNLIHWIIASKSLFLISFTENFIGI